MALSARIDSSKFGAAFERYYRFGIQRWERAALIATDRGATILKNNIRQDMASASLGKLGQAITSTSDLKKGGIQKRYGRHGFSASGLVYVRSRSERTVGALTSYLGRGSTRIAPRKGRWLWIATDNIPRLTNRTRMTPELYRKNGFEQKIGPLVLIKSVNGYPLLVAKNIGVSAAGKKRSARSLTKSGRARKGQVEKAFVVAFIGIPYTSREARVDPRELHAQVMSQLPELMRQALGRI